MSLKGRGLSRILFFYFLSSCFVGGKTPDVGSRTYANILREQQLRSEEQEVTLIYLFL